MSTGFHVGMGVLMFIGGYVAAVFTWEPFHTWLVGVETKISALQARIRALRGNP